MPASTRPKLQASAIFALASLLAIALTLRLVAASGEPWLDELWSWQIATDGDWLAAHDNNHPLNTLWLLAVGPYHDPLLWRLPAVLSGAITVMLAASLLRRFGTPHAVVGATFVTFCFPLIVYQSEARGYGTLLMCVMAALCAQMTLFDEPLTRRKARLALALICGTGVLSHLSFAIFYALLLSWTLLVAIGTRRSIRRAVVDHAGPAAIVAAWVLVFGLRLGIGGGPKPQPIDALAEAASLLTGWSLSLQHAALAIVVLIGCGAAVWIKGRGRSIGWMLAAGLLGFPLLAATVSPLVYPRYLLPAMLCGLLLAAIVAGEAWRRRPALRLPVAIGVAAWAAVQLNLSWPLLTEGRNQHAAALTAIAKTPTATFGSASEFQLRLIVRYHRPDLLDRVRPDVDSPEFWVVMNRNSPPTSVGQTAYVLDRLYPATWAGVPWQILRRDDSPRASAE